jgi:Tol biopolymer transport system component
VDISPDHTELLLCRHTVLSAPCELLAAPLLGGAARRLGDLATLEEAAWSPDGQQLVYPRDKELLIARSDGWEVRKLATLAGYPRFARWSPDGSRVRFTVSVGGSFSLWEARIDGNSAYPLLPGWNPTFLAAFGDWTQEGKYFVFLAGPKASYRNDLWALREKVAWFQRTERGPFQLTNGPLAVTAPVPGTDGKHLFVEGHQERNEFLRYDLKSGPKTCIASPAHSGASTTLGPSTVSLGKTRCGTSSELQ